MASVVVFCVVPFTAPTWGWWQVVANTLGFIGYSVVVLGILRKLYAWIARMGVETALELRHNWVGAVNEYEERRAKESGQQ